MNMTRYAVAILIALTMPARAQESANEMLPGCKMFLARSPRSLSDAEASGWCGGFVYGLFFAGEGTCPPERAKVSQALTVVIRYIEARPERMHEHFGGLAIEALTAAWPCKR